MGEGRGNDLPREDDGNGFQYRIREARARYGHSQREAAEAMGLPTNTVQTWEQGRRIPTTVLYVRAVEHYISQAP